MKRRGLTSREVNPFSETDWTAPKKNEDWGSLFPTHAAMKLRHGWGTLVHRLTILTADGDGPLTTVHCELLLAEEGGDDVVYDKGGPVGQDEHVGELKGGPLPAVGFAADHGHGGGAWHGECEEDHQRDGSAELHVGVQGRLQMHALGFRIGAVERAHGGDHDFARQHAGDEADADLPVEAERRNHGLDEVAKLADGAVGEFGRGVMAAGHRHRRNVREQPETQRYAKNDRASLAQEDFGAINETHDQRADGGHAVLRQLKDEGRFARFEDGAFEEARGGHGCDESGEVEAKHDDGAEAEESVEERNVRNECSDEEYVNRQSRRAGHEWRDENCRETVPLVFDGTRGHDGGHRAGIRREQREERLAIEADGAHDAIGDERGAGKIAGVFEDSDEKEEKQNLGEEDEH